jgi:hypothetical protein
VTVRQKPMQHKSWALCTFQSVADAEAALAAAEPGAVCPFSSIICPPHRRQPPSQS